MAPAHLDGTMLGDYGFDPLGLAADRDPETLAFLQDAELQNGRWAMAAVAGATFTDIVRNDRNGIPMWLDAGNEAQGGYSLATLAIVQAAVMGAVEYKRVYGGGIDIDFAGYKSQDKIALKELVHARLGMMAFAGIFIQGCYNGMGPVQALKAHIADPGHNVVYTDGGFGLFLLSQVFLMALVPFIQSTKSTFEEEEEEPLFEVWKA